MRFLCNKIIILIVVLPSSIAIRYRKVDHRTNWFAKNNSIFNNIKVKRRKI